MATSFPIDKKRRIEGFVFNLFVLPRFVFDITSLLLLRFGRFLFVSFNMYILLENVCRTNYVKFIDRFRILQWKWARPNDYEKEKKEINTHQHKREHPMLLYKRGYFSKDSIFRWKCICIDLLLLRCLLLYFNVLFSLSISCFSFIFALCVLVISAARLRMMWAALRLVSGSPHVWLLLFDFETRVNVTYFIFMQILLVCVLCIERQCSSDTAFFSNSVSTGLSVEYFFL